MLTAFAVLIGLGVAIGLILGYAAVRFRVEGDPLVDKIDALLPQTQCGQCGHPGCRPYAESMAAGEEDINRCPPGGEATIIALADLLGKEPLPLDPEAGVEKVEPTVAIIDENICIGCTLCIQACPVDAILGAAKLMHTVIEDECTGCELCIPPCPVECITMEPLKPTIGSWQWPYPEDLFGAAAITSTDSTDDAAPIESSDSTSSTDPAASSTVVSGSASATATTAPATATASKEQQP